MKDLTGERFGRLVVVKRVEDHINPSGGHFRRWLCQCDCGNQVTRYENNLKYHDSERMSCGCLAKENMSKRFKKYNEYDLSGEYGIGYTSKGEEFWFDLEDYELIKDICWKTDKDGYIVSSIYKADTKKLTKVSMHRLVMNCPDDKQVDHIHIEDKNDNRKENLRICTQIENARNHGLQSNNTSGYTGVYWHKGREKWNAFIYNHGKRIDLGLYDKLEDAAEVRRKAEEEIFGEFQFNYAN